VYRRSATFGYKTFPAKQQSGKKPNILSTLLSRVEIMETERLSGDHFSLDAMAAPQSINRY